MKLSNVQRDEYRKIVRRVEENFKEKSYALLETYDEEIRTLLEPLFKYGRAEVLDTKIGQRALQFLKQDGNKPSDFFNQEMNNMKGWVPEYLLEDFYCSVDAVNKWQVDESSFRRSLRSKKYTSYINRIFRIMDRYHKMGIYDTDLVSVYKGRLNSDLCATMQLHQSGFWSYEVESEWIQAELDRGNQELVEVFKEILLGDSVLSSVKYKMIRGIVMSQNHELYEVLGDLLLAARLQEGLRQAICDNMDAGTVEAFRYLFDVVVKNDLLRYSSVLRSVGTWTGLLGEEEGKLDRINKKQIAMISSYIQDEEARKTALQSEDSMQIYLALWSYGVFDADDAGAVLEQLALNGTKHQRMVCCYYLKTMRLNSMYVHSIAKEIVRQYKYEQDTMAVVMDSFMNDCDSYMNKLSNQKELRKKDFLIEDNTRVYADVHKYFGGESECQEFYDILMEIFSNLNKKQLIFDPCVFPWNRESLDRSAVINRMAVCASALKDEDKISEIAKLIPDIDASHYSRSMVMLFLLSTPQNEEQRKLLVGCVGDKETYTSDIASKIVANMKLSKVEYLQLEMMLKYKNAEIRKNVLSLLYKMDDMDLEACINRLLTEKKEEKRTAGLDLLMQIKQDENRTGLFVKCKDCLQFVDNPTTKEAILINELQKNGDAHKEDGGYGIYDIRAEYDPEFDLQYLDACKKEFSRIFSEGNRLKEIPHILQNLDGLVEEHKYDEFEDRGGNIRFLTESIWGIRNCTRGELPFDEIWTEFYVKEIKDYETCFLLDFYLDFLIEEEESFAAFCMPFITKLFGDMFVQNVTLTWRNEVAVIVSSLEKRNRNERLKRMLSVVVADALLNSINPIIYEWESKKEKDKDGNPKWLKRSMLTFEPIKTLTFPIDLQDNQEDFDMLFPYQYELANCHDFHIPSDSDGMRYFALSGTMNFPHVTTYIVAHVRGIISRDFLYKKLFQESLRDESMKCLTMIVQFYKERNRSFAKRKKEYSWVDKRRKHAVECLLGHEVSDEFSEEDIKRLDLAVQLYQDFSTLMIEAELTRGDSETDFSSNIYSVGRIYGVTSFVRILGALGTETLERSSYFNASWNRKQSVSKKQSLSHMLQVCIPNDSDTVDMLATLLAEMNIAESKLIEAAFYSPEWIPMVGSYLGWNGFESGCYYFMAHMNEEFDDKRKAMIARYTPIEISDLNDGAFDVDWFAEVYEQLQEEHFMLLYESAKYISDGAKHIRARKYADAALGKYKVSDVWEDIGKKRNKDMVMAYGLIPIISEDDIRKRYLNLQNFKKESKQFGAQRRASESRAVEISLQNLSINAGYQDVTRLILRMEALEFEDKRAFFEKKLIEDINVWINVSFDGKCELNCEKAGKKLKSIPAKYKKNEYIIALNEAKKEMTEQYRRTKAMFEDVMEKGETFSFSELKSLLDNPVTEIIVSNLVMGCNKGMGFVTSEGLLSVENGEQTIFLDNEEALFVVHPFHMFKADCWHAYQQYVFNSQIRQPFKQVFRELYVKTEEELNQHHSLRYAGNQIQPARTVGCLKSRHWVADVESGLQKIYYKENIVAQMYALADWFSPADIESPTLEWVVFSDRKTGEELKISNIPDIIFSEVMRDIDMAVSVAHAGGVDSETSHSTVEMRKAIAEFTMPLFKLTNVVFNKNHAIINGKRGNYTVHLGSGVIHQEGGPMINVLPVHSQRRGRIFLPFVDEDPKTAEVITKILFFAEDDKIKDPFILEQII